MCKGDDELNCAFAKVEKYISYLKDECGLSITVHDAGKGFISDNIVSLIPFNVHSNGYCLYAKTKQEVWDRCIFNQKKIVEKLGRNGAFYGMCYMGVEEFVFPIKAPDEIVGFVSVSGYGANREEAYKRICSASEKYFFDKYELLSKYDSELCQEIPSFEYVSTVVEPLCSMLALIYLTYGSKFERGSKSGGDNYIYGHILTYINRNYANKITVDDLCNLCHCSRSHISHLFTKKSGMGLCEFINRKRCREAKRYLAETDERIQEISFLVGFDDSNYFTNVFTKYEGMSPRAYRQQFGKS